LFVAVAGAILVATVEEAPTTSVRADDTRIETTFMGLGAGTVGSEAVGMVGTTVRNGARMDALMLPRPVHLS
jgi:hypothetical protein